MTLKQRLSLGVPGVALASGVALVVAWGIRQDKKADWFSAWSSAFSALIALAALGAAAFAVRETFKTNKFQSEQIKMQSEQLKMLEEAKIRERASQFAVWRYLDRGYRRSKLAGSQPEIYYRNASSTPMYNVAIQFSIDGAPVYMFQVKVLPPTNEATPLHAASDAVNQFIEAHALAEVTFAATPPESEGATGKEALDHATKVLAVTAENRNRRDKALREFEYSVKLEISALFDDGEYAWQRTPGGRLVLLGPVEDSSTK